MSKATMKHKGLTTEHSEIVQRWRPCRRVAKHSVHERKTGTLHRKLWSCQLTAREFKIP